MVKSSVWNKAWTGRRRKPDREILCIGCLEQRIGRTLTREDFTDHSLDDATKARAQPSASVARQSRRARSQHEPAGIDGVHAGHADRRVLVVHPRIHLRVEENVGVGGGGEVAHLADAFEGAGCRAAGYRR
jgi:hypothetical protein